MSSGKTVFGDFTDEWWWRPGFAWVHKFTYVTGAFRILMKILIQVFSLFEGMGLFVCRVLALLSSMHPFKGSFASCIIPIYSRVLSNLCTSCILPPFQDKYGYWGVRSSASGGPWCVWNTIEWADRKKRRSRMMPSPVIDRWTDDDDAVVVIIALGKLHGPTTTSFLKRDYQSWMCIWITFSTKSSMSI